MNDIKFIETLKQKRNACDYSQSRLAQELQISRQNLNEIENGKTKASKEMKHILLHYLDYCNCTQPFTLTIDYLRVRFPTTDALEIIKNVLAMKSEYFIHEDYGMYGYEEQYVYGDISVNASKDSSMGVLLELRGMGCRNLEYVLQARGIDWYYFLRCCIDYQGVFKRIDLAVNDMGGLLDIEIAVCVQTSSPKYELETVVNKILEIRGRRKKYINKKKFDRDLIHNAWKHYFKEEKNFHEYADMNLRYLSASGILKRSGRGITVMPEYKSLAYELTKNVISDATLKERYKLLCQGAPLPTDNTEIAKKVLEDLINELEMYNIKYEIPDITLDNSKNINIVRSNLKQNIDHYKEEKYAQNQRECWYEIYEYMKLLISNNGKSKELGEDYIINVPKAEAAAYLEWILWRAFLAIDHIVNKPYDANISKRA